MPKEIYRIPINICLDHLASADCMPISLPSNINQNYESDEDETCDHVKNSCCGDHCSLLSHRWHKYFYLKLFYFFTINLQINFYREKRKIFSTLTLNKTVQNLLQNSVLCPNDKVFFFIGSTQSNNFLENLRGLEEE